MTQQTEQVTSDVLAKYKKHHGIISNTKNAFVLCGQSMMVMQSERLYRAYYKTFKEYCEKEHGFTRRRAYQIIEAAQVQQALPKNVNHGTQNERQLRELSKIPQENREAVLKRAEESGQVTAASIAKAAKDLNVEPEKFLDQTGLPIPDSIQEVWRRAHNTGTELLRAISAVRSTIRQGFELDANGDRDVIYAEVTNSIIPDLNGAYGLIKCMIPYAVCTSCQGHRPNKCTLCKGRGFISEFGYKNWLPEETRAMRDKFVKRG